MDPLTIGLVSDTHMPRKARQLPAALREGLKDRGVSLILHAGDFTDQDVASQFEAIAPFDAVAGNNDGPDIVQRFGRRKVVTVAGVRIGLVHGDGFRGTTLKRAIAAFEGEPVEVIVFGHSHSPFCERHDGTWLINPGSPTDKRWNPRYSFGILTVTRGIVRPEICFYDSK